MAPQIFPSLGPALMISMGYIDLGKWVAALEGGASFGFSLVPLVIFLNCCAIFCQYLATSIGVATEKNLAQIYSAEYSRSVCLTLGLEAEISAIAMDISTILGVAHGICLISGLDIVACILLATVVAVVLPFSISRLDDVKAEVLCLGISAFALLFYVLGVLISQPEIPFAGNGVFPKLTGETAYSVMALLGSNIMAHNFYTHSSAVQQPKRSTNVAVDALCHDHFFAVLFVFSGIFLVNYVLVNSAASVFNHSGLTVSTFQDAFLLLDQVFRIPIPPVAFLLVLLFSSTVTAFSWKIGGLVILRDLLHVSFPPLAHQVLVRTLAAFFALLCAQSAGAEGLYQLLVICQVVSAMLLPSSVIPLFRVASSRPLMGSSKISWHLEIAALIAFFGILASNILFTMELFFGSSSWVASLRGLRGFSLQFMAILLVACLSLALTLYLAVTPLNSASHARDFEMWAIESPQDHHPRLPEAAEDEGERDADMLIKPGGDDDDGSPVMPPFLSSLDDPSTPEFHLPEMKIDQEESDSSSPPPPITDLSPLPSPESAQDGSRIDSDLISEDADEAEQSPSVKPADCHVAAENIAEGIPPKPAAALKAPPPKEKVNGADAPKSSGLGRSARRTFAAVLDDFWKALFDLHGTVTPEAVAKRLDVLLGLDQKTGDPPAKAAIFPGGAAKNPAAMAPRGQVARDYSPSLLGQMGPTSWSSPSTVQLLNSLGQNSWNNAGQNLSEAGERRYSSLRLPQNSNTWDYQPATIHGHQTPSYVGRFSSPAQTPVLKPANLSGPTYKDPFAPSQEEARFSSLTSSPLQGLSISRSAFLEPPLQSSAENGSLASSAYAKKYHSLPDISGFTVAGRAAGNSQWGPIGRIPRGSLQIPKGGSSFDDYDYSSSGLYGIDPLLGAKSLWSRQPFEQFYGAAAPEEAFSYAESETATVQSLKVCLRKLLKLDGSEWLFRQDGGADEWIIDRIAAKERFLAELGGEADPVASVSGDGEIGVPNCGEGCIWRMGLVVSFGVWCIIRILELSQLESRPELWGKYTYVLNRLQGILELAFGRARPPPYACPCLNIPAAYRRAAGTSPPANEMQILAGRAGRGTCTSAIRVLEIVKDVEVAISGRRGRTGTAAGDIAFPKGKENLASVLKRYKRRLSAKPPAPAPAPASVQEVSRATRRVPLAMPPPGF